MYLQRNAVMAVAIILIANCQGATIKPDSAEDQEETVESITDLLSESVVHDCVTPEFSLDDFSSLFQGNATRTGKCFWACFFKKFDVLNDKNEVSIEAVMKLDERIPDVSIGSTEDVFICNDEDIVEKCSNISDEDECEAAFKLLDCAQNACPQSAELLSEEEEDESSKES